MGTKTKANNHICRTCRVNKDRKEFPKSDTNLFGIETSCIDCQKILLDVTNAEKGEEVIYIGSVPVEKMLDAVGVSMIYHEISSGKFSAVTPMNDPDGIPQSVWHQYLRRVDTKHLKKYLPKKKKN